MAPAEFVPPDCVKVPVPDEPTISAPAASDPPVIPEAESLTVRAPEPKLTCPVPESISPSVRLIEPLVAAMMVPWQVTGSEIVPHPPNPVPPDTVNVVPAVWVRPSVRRQLLFPFSDN